MKPDYSGEKEIRQKVENVLDLLELDAPVPESLLGRVLEAKKELEAPRVRKFNLAPFLQAAAAIALGVFIGHQFGKFSGTRINKPQEDQLVQYLKAHHLGMEDTGSSAFHLSK